MKEIVKEKYMNQQELEQNFSEIIDKYLLRTTEKVSEDCSSVIIRAALEERIDEYFPKSSPEKRQSIQKFKLGQSGAPIRAVTAR